MSKTLYWFLNSLLLIIPFLMDRISKQIIVQKNITLHTINDFLYFDLTYNRGMSWGMFNSTHNYMFIVITTLVILITLFVVYLTYKKIKNKELIIGELLIIAGSVSNIIDRFIYGGVVDFIILSYNGWSWPVFNIADACIVVGAIIMFITSLWETPGHPERVKRVERV